MRSWQKEAIKLFREAKGHALQTENPSLHRACAQAINAMIAEGGCVPLDLRRYAAEMPKTNGVGCLSSQLGTAHATCGDP